MFKPVIKGSEILSREWMLNMWQKNISDYLSCYVEVTGFILFFLASGEA